MADKSVENILQQLRSGDPHEAWTRFLDEYSGLIFQVSRHLESDLDRASDCFQFVCQKLSEDRFRRLLSFKPDGPATFSTWLRAVVRNLCLDWRRKEFGRKRRFRSIQRLSVFDQELFGCVYEQRMSTQDAFVSLGSKFPDVTPARIAESSGRIEASLTPKQRWALGVQAARRTPAKSEILEEDLARLEIRDDQPDPEAKALLAERRTKLGCALKKLSKRDRLVVQLRFEQELTLEQIAKLLDLGNAQRADRQIKEILARLHEEMK
jgi:RNA polymerase sigma factor (sigma-70 family)